MNIRFGIYDIFSRIVPGGLYLFAALEFVRASGWFQFDWTLLDDIGIFPSLVLTMIAYIVGTAMDPIGSAWHRLFNPGRGTQILADFKAEHENRWELDFEHTDWPILRAYIYLHNLNVGDEIDRHNALYMMLRNISFGFILLAVSQIMQFIITGNWLFLVLAAFLFLFSCELAVQARGMRRWFYRSIYETIIADRLKVEELMRPAKSSLQVKTFE